MADHLLSEYVHHFAGLEAHLLGAVKNIINLLRQNLFFLAVSYLRNVCPAPADSISIALMH